MRLQDGEYNKKEKNPNVVELDLVMMEWSLELVGDLELVRKTYLVVIDLRLTHPKRRSVEVKERRWTPRMWRMMAE